MKERFLAGGLEGFSDHEVLELILFYAIPRRDVNELSHKLVERFGSFRAVFDADFEDLCAVDGIGENAAILIKLMSVISLVLVPVLASTTCLWDLIVRLIG
jgi:DNA repair protein RadC